MRPALGYTGVRSLSSVHAGHACGVAVHVLGCELRGGVTDGAAGGAVGAGASGTGAVPLGVAWARLLTRRSTRFSAHGTGTRCWLWLSGVAQSAAVRGVGSVMRTCAPAALLGGALCPVVLTCVSAAVHALIAVSSVATFSGVARRYCSRPSWLPTSQMSTAKCAKCDAPGSAP
jgi:hypothetical protein